MDWELSLSFCSAISAVTAEGMPGYHGDMFLGADCLAFLETEMWE